MTRFLVWTASALLALTSIACQSAEDSTGAAEPAGADAADAAPAEAAEKTYTLIEDLGIEIKVPAGAEIMDSGANVMVASYEPACTLLVGKVGDMSSDFDGTMRAVKGGMAGGELKEIFEETQTDDGWVVTYATAAMTDPDATRYGVNVRVKAGDQKFDCSRVSDSREASDCVLEACKSIRVADAG